MNKAAACPRIVLLAGPNGAGKTTLTQEYLEAVVGSQLSVASKKRFSMFAWFAYWRLRAVIRSLPTEWALLCVLASLREIRRAVVVDFVIRRIGGASGTPNANDLRLGARPTLPLRAPASSAVKKQLYQALRKTATTLATSTTKSRLSPSKSTGMAPLGLNRTLSYLRSGMSGV
jgi:hypothetical protein